MFFNLVILFTVIPALEIYLIINATNAIGGTNTFAIVVLTGVVGAYLAKSQGRAVLNNIQLQMSQGQMPAIELVHGFLIFGGGLLLLTPGFLTDFIGLSMVIPGSRHLLVKVAQKKFKSAIQRGSVKVFTQGGFSNSEEWSRGSQERLEDEVIEADFKHKD